MQDLFYCRCPTRSSLEYNTGKLPWTKQTISQIQTHSLKKKPPFSLVTCHVKRAIIHSELFWYVNKRSQSEKMRLPCSTSSVVHIWIRTPHCALLTLWPLYISLQSQLPFSTLPQMLFLFTFSKYCKATFRPSRGLCENKTQLLIHLKRSLFSYAAWTARQDRPGSNFASTRFHMALGDRISSSHETIDSRVRECVCGWYKPLCCVLASNSVVMYVVVSHYQNNTPWSAQLPAVYNTELWENILYALKLLDCCV